MTMTLSKGGNLSLTKQDPAMKRALVGLGWDARSAGGAEFDLDASAFLLDANGRIYATGEQSFVFYNNLATPDKTVTHTGDNRTGAGDGDDEQILVQLDQLPAAVQKIAITVTIHDASARRQSFGQVSNAFIRIVNDETQREVARYDLTEDGSTETAMIFAELYRYGSEWKLRAVGQGWQGGLKAMCDNYGLKID